MTAERSSLIDDWISDVTARLNSVIDEAERSGDGDVIEGAGRLLVRLANASEVGRSLEHELAKLEGSGTRSAPDLGRRNQVVRLPSRQPPSFLLLPAGGDDSSRHFTDTVERPVDPDRLDLWLLAEAAAIRSRITNYLAAWGLRDNTRLRTTPAAAPLIWNRIYPDTLALFSDGYEYVCSARVIGKGRSDRASEELWGSPEFRWLTLLTDVAPTRVPLNVVIAGAGFDPTYRINRQAIVPKPYREPELWAALQRYGFGDSEEAALT